jgi:hypothetical protein
MEVSSDAEGSSDFTRDFSIEDIDMSLTRCGLLPERAEELARLGGGTRPPVSGAWDLEAGQRGLVWGAYCEPEYKG